MLTAVRKASNAMKIDAHQHFWRYDPARDAWITEEMSALRRDFLPTEFLKELAANDMDGSIAVQAASSEEETFFLIRLAEANPAIAGVVGWIDFTSPSAPKRVEFFTRFEKLRGFRHIVQSEPDDRFLMRNDFLRGIKHLAAFYLTYDILIYPKQLPAAAELVERLPDQPFVIDHLAKPCIKAKEIDTWATYMRALASHPNVFCKLSGLITEADWKNWQPEDFRPYLDVVFEAFGPERLMFGSDWPVCLLAGTYARVKNLIAEYVQGRPTADREKIFGGNAIRFYGLKSFLHGPATRQ